MKSKETSTQRVGRLWNEVNGKGFAEYISRELIWEYVYKGLTDVQIHQKVEALNAKAEFELEHQDDLPNESLIETEAAQNGKGN